MKTMFIGYIIVLETGVEYTVVADVVKSTEKAQQDIIDILQFTSIDNLSLIVVLSKYLSLILFLLSVIVVALKVMWMLLPCSRGYTYWVWNENLRINNVTVSHIIDIIVYSGLAILALIVTINLEDFVHWGMISLITL